MTSKKQNFLLIRKDLLEQNKQILVTDKEQTDALRKFEGYNIY
jgi:hypothetical protein